MLRSKGLFTVKYLVTEVRTRNGIVINSKLCRNVISCNGFDLFSVKTINFRQDGCYDRKLFTFCTKWYLCFGFDILFSNFY